MSFRAILGTFATVLTLVAYLPYVASIRRGETKPHVFSWIVWGATTCIVFFAQLAAGGGAGAWPIGVSGAVTLYVAALACARRGDASITRADVVFFVLAMSSLPAWYFARDPFSAVVILTATDLLGFGPTFRKAYTSPHEEQLGFFVMMAIRNALAAAALETWSVTTALFPSAVGAACVLFVSMVIGRRSTVRADPADATTS